MYNDWQSRNATDAGGFLRAELLLRPWVYQGEGSCAAKTGSASVRKDCLTFI